MNEEDILKYCLKEACDKCRMLNYRISIEKLLEQEINSFINIEVLKYI